MSYRIEQSYPRLAEEEISRLESQVGHALPEPYRDFLAQHNGGVPYNNTFDVPSQMHDGRYLYSFTIRRFLGLTAKGHDDILRVRANLASRMPVDLLPIAIDHFRNFMCLNVRSGEVFFFDLQNAIKAERPGQPLLLQLYLHRVASSFDDMMEHLYHKRFS